jgi:hypothetical protein
MNNQQKKLPTLEGHTQKVSSVLTVITSPSEIQAAIEGNLTVENKRVLVCKGGSEMAETVKQVYQAFREHTDLHDHEFVLSRRLKGICHHDNWNDIVKISAHDYTQYLTHWLTFGTLLTSGEGTNLRLDAEHPALALSDKLPNFACQIWQQSRWLTPTIAGWFKWLED